MTIHQHRHHFRRATKASMKTKAARFRNAANLVVGMEAVHSDPDEQLTIEQTLMELCDQAGCCLVVTTGGTGPASRVLQTPSGVRILGSFGEQMRRLAQSRADRHPFQANRRHPRQLLSSISRENRARSRCLLAVFPAIPYCIDLIDGPFLTTHENVVKAFRPKK